MIFIREMTGDDVGKVSELEAEIFSMPWTERDFLQMVHADYAHYYVAEESGDIVGCLGVRNLCGDGEITNVAVRPGYRRRGIAGRLLEHLFSQGENHGIRAYTLEVRGSNEAAICLYRKYGFREEGIRRGFYEKPAEDALIMWKRQETDGEIPTIL